MEKETLELFQTLTELNGASGFEHDVRHFMKRQLEKYKEQLVKIEHAKNKVGVLKP